MIDIRVLRAAGLTDSQIVKVLAADQAERIARRREQNRKNQQNHRSRQHVSQNVADSADPPPPLSNGSPITPPITILSTPDTKASALADVVGEDPRARLFRIGKTILVSFGVAEKRTGGLLGLWLKSRNDPEGLLAAIEFARNQNVVDPVAYISAVLQGRSNGNGQYHETLTERCERLAAEARRLEREAELGRAPDAFGGD